MRKMRGLTTTIFASVLLIATSCSQKEEAVYATLQGSDKVENVLNKKEWSVPTAHYVALSPNEKFLLVSSTTEPKVYLMDVKTGETLNVFEVGPVPQGVMVDPQNHYAVAVSQNDNSVTILDLKKREKVKTLPIGDTPHNAVFSRDGKLAYITLQGEGKIAVLDMDKLEKREEFPTEGIDYPHNLDLSEDGKTLWIRDFVGNVAAVDVESRKVLAVIPVSAGHAGIDIIAGGRYVFTGGIAAETVDVIDPQTFQVVKKIEVGQGSHGVRSDKKGDLVYVGVTGTNEIVVIDTHTLEIKEKIATNGKMPFWVVVSQNP